MFYQTEQLVKLMQYEMEHKSQEAWKYAYTKKESIFQIVIKSLRLEYKKSQTEHSSCVAC